MSVEDIGDWMNLNATNRGIVHSALILAGSIVVIAAPLCLLSIVMGLSGSGGPWGVSAAAAVCILAGVAADGVAALVQRAASPLASLLAGMTLRLLPPLVVCLILALREGGSDHLAFVVYLLVFYLVILSLDTWWAVQRVPGRSGHSNHRSN
ncbi:MAG: hypothetical protein WD738_17375 [Pirellulales bacterium]